MAGLLQHSSSTASVLFGGMGNGIISRFYYPKTYAATGSYLRLACNSSTNGICAFFFNPAEDLVIKEALKESVDTQESVQEDGPTEIEIE